MELIHPIFKWLHIIAGITWIGLLYFFNWINGHVVATMDADTKQKVVPELMPRTLYFFRWGAAWTWVTGVVLWFSKKHADSKRWSACRGLFKRHSM